MGFSVATPPSSGPLFAEMALTEGQTQGIDGEGVVLPQEGADAEMLQQARPQGVLKGESKPYSFVKDGSEALPQKLQDYLSDMNRPKESKWLDINKQSHHLSFKESYIKTKEFKVLESHSQNLEGKSEKQSPNTTVKTTLQAAQSLEKGRAPQSAAQLKQNAVVKQHQTQTRTLENKVRQDFTAKQRSDAENRKQESKEQARTQDKRGEKEVQEGLNRMAERSEEREQQHKRRDAEEEEGFAGGQQDGSHQESEKDEKEFQSINKIDDAYIKEFADYGAQDSILSEILNMRVSQFDVLILFMEIMKLDIKGREQERISRQQERDLQIEHMKNIVENYKDQGTWARRTGIGAGIFGILSGAIPIIGHMKGDWLIEKLGTIFESIRDAKKKELFKNIGTMTNYMSEMQKSTGQAYQTFAEGNRTFDQHMSDLYRTDHDERTRTMEEIKDNWKGIENFLHQTLQMHHDAIRQLYS